MKKVFGYDGFLITFLSRLWNSMWLSLLFWLCCLPVVTAGMSYSALYYSVRKSVQNERGYVTPSFFRCIRANWRQTLPAGTVLAALGFLLWGDWSILNGMLESGSPLGNARVVPIVIGALVLLYALWVFAYICRFEMPLRTIARNAAYLAMRHIFTTLAAGVLTALTGLLIYMEPLTAAILPALCVWLISLLFEGVFRQYMTEKDKALEDMWNLDESDEARARREKLKAEAEADGDGE